MERREVWVSLALVGWLLLGVLHAEEYALTYAWRGDLLGIDAATKTLTLRVKIPDHITKYINGFKPGDGLVLVWDMLNKSESDSLLMIDSANPSNSKRLDHGYVLPAEFVSADKNAVTVKLHVDDRILQSAASLRAGTRIRATAAINEPTDTAAVRTIAAADEDQATVTR